MILSRRLLLAAGAALALPSALRAQAPRRPPLAATLEAARGLDQLHAIVVAQGGETLVAEALRGPAPDRAVNVKSVSKTLVAALLGAALDRGAVPALGATLGEVAPGLIPAEADPRVRDLTLEDLVTMRAGLERTSGGNYGAWVSSRNWLAYALSRPMVAEPGSRMLYSTGSFHILGAALSEATDRSLLALMRDWLGRPLGIEIPPWTQDPQGFYPRRQRNGAVASGAAALRRDGPPGRPVGRGAGPVRRLGAPFARAADALALLGLGLRLRLVRGPRGHRADRTGPRLRRPARLPPCPISRPRWSSPPTRRGPPGAKAISAT